MILCGKNVNLFNIESQKCKEANVLGKVVVYDLIIGELCLDINNNIYMVLAVFVISSESTWDKKLKAKHIEAT